jgi:tRNA 2-thiocytidine biosynthesis protein TtcA
MTQSDVSKKLLRDMGRAITEHQLIQDGDRLLVAMSGGKDSYAMMTLLEDLRPRAPVSFELVAVHVDQGQPGYDGAPLRAWLENFGVPFHIVTEDTYSIVIDKTPEGKTYCALCSRLRRGVLYSTAKRLGCNKVALGHHRDDTVETLLLNMFFAGKLSAMPAKLLNDEGDIEVIRPLIYCAEDQLAAFAREQAYPILPCNLCGSQEQAQRKQMKALLGNLEKTHPHVKQSVLAALSNVSPTHLLDPTIGRIAEKTTSPRMTSTHQGLRRTRLALLDDSPTQSGCA